MLFWNWRVKFVVFLFNQSFRNVWIQIPLQKSKTTGNRQLWLHENDTAALCSQVRTSWYREILGWGKKFSTDIDRDWSAYAISRILVFWMSLVKIFRMERIRWHVETMVACRFISLSNIAPMHCAERQKCHLKGNFSVYSKGDLDPFPKNIF